MTLPPSLYVLFLYFHTALVWCVRACQFFNALCFALCALLDF